MFGNMSKIIIVEFAGILDGSKQQQNGCMTNWLRWMHQKLHETFATSSTFNGVLFSKCSSTYDRDIAVAIVRGVAS